MPAEPWRKIKHHGREKGYRVYIPANVVNMSVKQQNAGPVVAYKVKPWGKNTVIVRFAPPAEVVD